MPTRRLLPALLATALAAGCAEETTGPGTTSEPRLQLSATALAFQGTAGGTAPAAQAVTVTNAGGGQLAAPVASVATASGGGWLAATVSGAAPPFTVSVAAAPGALTAGTYEGTVTLASAGASNSPRAIAVTLVVAQPRPPAMVLSASALDFAAQVGGASPAAQAVTVTNGGELPLGVPTATVAAGAPWLSAAVAGTASPYTVTVGVDSTGLAAATYHGTVTLEAAGAEPREIAVTLLVGAPRAVTVSRLLTSWGDAGAGTPVADAAVQAVALRQDDGAGGLTTIAAAPGTAAGTWTATVPPGAYWAVVTWSGGSQTWVRASAAALDLGADVPGRAGRVTAASTTPATLDLYFLDTWSVTNDSLRLASFGAQAEDEFTSGLPPMLPLSDGDSDLLGFAFDWDQTLGVLLAPEDSLWLTQLRSRLNGTGRLPYKETRTWSVLTGASVTDGAALTLQPPDAQFVTGAGQLALDWRRSEFEAALPPFTSTNPTAHRVTIAGLPAALTAPAPLGGLGVPLLEAFRAPTTPQSPDFNAGTLSYGRFLPAAWSELLSAGLAVPVSRTAPGATAAVPGLQNRVQRQDAAASAPAPVRPLLGGVRSPTIDGADALAAQSGRSTRPALAWTAPAIGTASSYRVTVHELTASGAASVATPVALLVVDGATTSLTLPPGLLQAGRTYLAEIVARASPGDAGGASPFRVGVPFGESAVWTAAFSTAP